MSRVHLTDYGTRIEAYDRAPDHDDAKMLGEAVKAEKKLDSWRGWSVRVNGEHSRLCDTKAEAKRRLLEFVGKLLSPAGSS